MDSFFDSFVGTLVAVYDYALLRVTTEMIIYIAIALVILIFVYMLSRFLKRRKLASRLSDLEISVNEIRNNSLQYKFNRASAFSKSAPEIKEKMDQLTPKFEVCMKSIRSCETLYDSAQDKLERHRYKKCIRTMDELETMITDTHERIRIVNNALENILKQEEELRQKTNALKERFRTIRNIYQSNRPAYFSGAFYLESLIQSVDDEFTNLEEWMYSSDYHQAKEEVEKIALNVDTLQGLTDIYPGLYRIARQEIPAQLKVISAHIKEIDAAGVDITTINASGKLEAITNALSDAIVKLDNGNYKVAQAALDMIKEQVELLQDDIDKERKAFDEIHGNMDRSFLVVDEIARDLQEVKELYGGIRDRFGLEDWSIRFSQADGRMIALKEERDRIKKLLEEDTPQANIVHEYREFAETAAEFKKQAEEMKRMLLSAFSDENRAKKQILKLELILNEVKLKAWTSGLPKLSKQFEEDLKKGEKMLSEVKYILNTSPLDVAALNESLQESIDYIYKLYNSINTLETIAELFENSIVFGNRYRTSYPNLNSDLTRAELLFSNGEYSRALNISIQALDILHPGLSQSFYATQDPALLAIRDQA